MLQVIWTDVFQLFFMFLSTGYIIVVATQRAGGAAKVENIMIYCRKLACFLNPPRWWIETLRTPDYSCSTWPLILGRGNTST